VLKQGNNGLAYLIRSLLQVGTLGMPTDALDEERKAAISEKLDTDHDSVVCYPKDSDLNGHYSHFCKTILWPVLHYQIPDNPKSKAYLDHSWVYYVKINQLFANKIVQNYKKGDIIWIHDYHLLLVPKLVREKLPEAQIGFFLHIAFPSSEVFRCLAVRTELLEGMLGANLIGFQTREYCHHFLQTCNRILRVEATSTGIQLETRFVDVATFPIGIDPGILQAQREDSDVLDWLERLQRKYAGKYLIVARDKLDHVRGVRQKLLAYELLLNRYPEFRENVVMIQVATSASDSGDLDATVSDIVTRINSSYSSLAHQPLIYLKKDLDYQQYIAMITAADALMITSLREGMNLTSHEFVLCQDGKYSKKKHGSLILSEFTGSSAVFEGNDLSVNPWDYRQCANAMHTALTMSAKEKEERWTNLKEIVERQNAEHWLRTFLKSLQKAYDEQSRQHTVSIPRLSINELASKYRASKNRLFMLDYEGTLASHGSPLSIPFVSPQRTIDCLNQLLEPPGNTVYVMSGRKPEELEAIFTRVPGLGLVAENGCFIKHAGSAKWTKLADMEKMNAWKDSIMKILEYYNERLEGSTIESRYCSIYFSYAKAKDQQAAARLSGECASHLNDACQNLHVHAVPCDGGLLIESTDFNKQTAGQVIVERMQKSESLGTPDFLLVAGDAREDEVIYRWANELGKDGVIKNVRTVSVGSRNTEAMATLTSGVTGTWVLFSYSSYIYFYLPFLILFSVFANLTYSQALFRLFKN
jgi:trehalose 6-phosphate synthase complex regulatory subunit